jgi:hypothetical protein
VTRQLSGMQNLSKIYLNKPRPNTWPSSISDLAIPHQIPSSFSALCTWSYMMSSGDIMTSNIFGIIENLIDAFQAAAVPACIHSSRTWELVGQLVEAVDDMLAPRARRKISPDVASKAIGALRKSADVIYAANAIMFLEEQILWITSNNTRPIDTAIDICCTAVKMVEIAAPSIRIDDVNDAQVVDSVITDILSAFTILATALLFAHHKSAYNQS